MPCYETTFIARQDMSTNELDKLTDAYTKVVQERGGQIVKKEYWGLRTLAYPIKKNRKGHYVFLGVDAPYDAVKEIDRLMGFNEDVLRKLVIKVDAIRQEPSPVLSSQDQGDDSEVELVSENENEQGDA